MTLSSEPNRQTSGTPRHFAAMKTKLLHVAHRCTQVSSMQAPPLPTATPPPHSTELSMSLLLHFSSPVPFSSPLSTAPGHHGRCPLQLWAPAEPPWLLAPKAQARAAVQHSP